MLCTHCKHHSCRQLESCGAEAFDREVVRKEYQDPAIQSAVQTAAQLVDNGRAGILNRLQEIIEFARGSDYQKIGLAYCYGMEADARKVTELMRQSGFKVEAVSCTTGAIAQDEINTASSIHNVSCNPLGQAAQLQSTSPDLVVMMGLCMGHDILFQQKLRMPMTTLVVKDRPNSHNPLLGIRDLYEQQVGLTLPR